MRLPFAREGAPFLLVPLALTAVALAAGWLGAAPPLAAAPPALFALFSLFFFRDPERTPPPREGAVVAPADGRVTAVTVSEDPERPGHRVSIFLSIFSVHVNRSPTAGRVREIRYRTGEFRAAFRGDAAERNERNEMDLACERGSVGVRQIAGVVARRIVCRASVGDFLGRGERFGLIRFGSRTEVLLPPNCPPTVRRGDRVRGGETVIAEWS